MNDVDQDAYVSTRMAAFSADAKRFSFFRLVYLLERLYRNAPPVGHTGPASDERIRLRGDVSLVFQSSDVTEVEHVKSPDGVKRARVSAGFMGLYGGVSPLPGHFAETIALGDYQGGPQPVREFFDVFHHRLFSLVYRVWTKYRLGVGYRKGGLDPFSRRMFCAVGHDGFAPHQTPIERFLYVKYAPLLVTRARTARGLEVILRDQMPDVPVRIEQFIGHWTLIEKPLRNRLGVVNRELSVNLTIGRWVYNGTGRYKIILGPLEYDQYLSFLPGGAARPRLRSLVHAFTRGMADAVLELRIKPEAAPRFQLGSKHASHLRRTTWVGGATDDNFVLLVPLDDYVPSADDDDDERGEPPPDVG
jgi:type VI secretion system protein ImpH